MGCQNVGKQSVGQSAVRDGAVANLADPSPTPADRSVLLMLSCIVVGLTTAFLVMLGGSALAQSEAPPQLQIVRTMYGGHDGGASCPGGASIDAAVGDAVTYCYTMSNTASDFVSPVFLDAETGVDAVTLVLIDGVAPVAPGRTTTWMAERLTIHATTGPATPEPTATVIPATPNATATPAAPNATAVPQATEVPATVEPTATTAPEATAVPTATAEPGEEALADIDDTAAGVRPIVIPTPRGGDQATAVDAAAGTSAAPAPAPAAPSDVTPASAGAMQAETIADQSAAIAAAPTNVLAVEGIVAEGIAAEGLLTEGEQTFATASRPWWSLRPSSGRTTTALALSLVTAATVGIAAGLLFYLAVTRWQRRRSALYWYTKLADIS